MDIRFEVFAIISRPVADVYEAVADPAKLSAYFTTNGAQGRLQAGARVMWDFADFPGAFPVTVVDAKPHEQIVLRWAANDAGAAAPYETKVIFRFEAIGADRTRVRIVEEGWHQTPTGLAASYGNCMGWSQMLCGMKAWMEHGLNLRDGMYV